jgi:Nif-specific regulatory protein
VSEELVAAERDLYRRLIELAAHDDLDALLDEAISVVLELAGAVKGVVAVREAGLETIAFVGCDAGEQARIRGELDQGTSRGIIAESIASGKTVATASARVDPRFAGNKSVQTARIEAVVCAPIGGAGAASGALYVAGRRTPGPFTAREVVIVETCAKGLVPFLARLASRARASRGSDATADVRARMPAANVVGRSAAIARTLSLAHVASSSDVAVLLSGETGSGKGAIARAIHDASARASRPFVTIDCASIPETLVESELFGAEKGAHSTATKRIAGKLAAADHGTVFLDEIGELPLESQSKLLSFLQTKRFTPLGATSPTEIDARIIAATNADLEARVRDKTFREDLFYRLCVLAIRVPPLRERREDVGLLADAFVARHGADLALTFGARAALVNAEFPGNVRELEAAIDRGVAFARAEGTALVDAHHVFHEAPKTQGADAGSYQEQMRTHQARILREALERAGGAQGAAKALGLSRSRFYELVRAHEIKTK